MTIVIDLIGSTQAMHKESETLVTNAKGLGLFILCRKLIADGYDPTEMVEVMRGTTLCFQPISLGAWADKTVQDDKSGRPRFVKYREKPDFWRE